MSSSADVLSATVILLGTVSSVGTNGVAQNSGHGTGRDAGPWRTAPDSATAPRLFLPVPAPQERPEPMIPKDVVEEPEPPKKKRRRKFRTADPEPDKLVRPQARPLSAPSRTRCRTRSPAEPDKWVDQLVEYPAMQAPRDTHLPEEQQNLKSEEAKVKDFQRFTPFAKIEAEGHQSWKFRFPASAVNPEGDSERGFEVTQKPIGNVVLRLRCRSRDGTRATNYSRGYFPVGT